MPENIFHILWLILWAIYLFGIYGPSARRFRKAKIAQEHSRPVDVLLDFIVFFAWQLFPLVYVSRLG